MGPPQRPATRPGRSESAIPATPSATVLCVDDSPDSRLSIALLLRAEGYRVREAGTGAEALALASDVDLVVLDVHLPDLDGFAIARRVKADPATALVPVVMLSGVFTRSADKVAGLDGGGDVYLTKPVEPREFLGQVRALLRVREGHLALGRQAEELREAKRRLEAALAELRDSHWHLRKLQEVLPICMDCGKVKAGTEWGSVVQYLKANALFLSHGYCPNCLDRVAAEWGVPPGEVPTGAT